MKINYKHVATKGCSEYSDELLLDEVSRLEVKNGWGLIAELCKRYEKLNGKSNKTR